MSIIRFFSIKAMLLVISLGQIKTRLKFFETKNYKFFGLFYILHWVSKET